MGRLVLQMGLSLDGLIAHPGQGRAGEDVPPEAPALTARKLGEGLSLFAGLAEPLVLDLVEATAYDDSSVLHIYHPRPGKPAR